MTGRRSSLRREEILDLLGVRDELTVTELAERFAVTPMTVRRDLDALANEGRVTRTHGGAILAAPSVARFAFQERRLTRQAAKRAIARAAAERVEPGMTVILDTGTTTLELAKILVGVPDLRVLTTSLAIASALFAQKRMELILLGGTVSAASPDLTAR